MNLALLNPDHAMFSLSDPMWLLGLLAVLLLTLLTMWTASIARQRLQRFAEDDRLQELLVGHAPGRRALRNSVMLAALALVVLALAGPESDPEEIETQSRGRDIVFVIDVSRSMLASDLAPNRLDRSKLWIKDLVAQLDGDRVGLVAFAGAAVVKSPLTLDRTFFNLTLDELNPSSAPIGGTYIGDAIRKTMNEVFFLLPGEETAAADLNEPVRDIVLITDGDDQESFPAEAAAVAGAAGVRIITIGVGGERGALVPDRDTDGYLQYQGQAVRSAMNPETLAAIAGESAGGVFLNVGTGEIDLAQVDRDLRSIDARRITGSGVSVIYQPRFYMPLGLALLLLMLEPLIPEWRQPRRSRTSGATA